VSPAANTVPGASAVDPAIEPHLKKFRRELAAGLVALVLLAVLAEAEGELYGYEIAKRLKAPDEGQEGASALSVSQGALYPVLRQLADGALLESRVEPSVSGPPRRYYRITPLGRAVLGHWQALWNVTRDSVDQNLAGTRPGRHDGEGHPRESEPRESGP